MTDRIYRRREVEEICGVGRSTLYDWMKGGTFPKSVRLGTRAVGWRESDIHAWLESRQTRGAV